MTCPTSPNHRSLLPIDQMCQNSFPSLTAAWCQTTQRPPHTQRRLQRVPGVVQDSPWWRHSAEDRLCVYIPTSWGRPSCTMDVQGYIGTVYTLKLTLLLPQFLTLPWYRKKLLENYLLHHLCLPETGPLPPTVQCCKCSL